MISGSLVSILFWATLAVAATCCSTLLERICRVGITSRVTSRRDQTVAAHRRDEGRKRKLLAAHRHRCIALAVLTALLAVYPLLMPSGFGEVAAQGTYRPPKGYNPGVHGRTRQTMSNRLLHARS